MVLTDQQFWAHVEEMRDGRLKCNFCGHLFAARTSISRIKWHFSGVKGRGVSICGQVPRDVQEAAYQATDGANKRHKPVPSSSNNVVCNATSTCLQEQNNESANLTGDATIMLTQHLDTQEEMGEDQRNFSGAENQIENLTRETSQPIQRSVNPERLPAEEQETIGAVIQTADLVGPATSRSWGEIQTWLMKDSGLISEANTTISTSLEAQNGEEAEADPLAALQPLYRKLVSTWESRLLQIRAMLDDAEQMKMTNQAMKIWLKKLRDLAYDVEDELDEYETEALTSKLKEAESQASTSTVIPSAAMLNGPKLQKIAARWEDIIKEKNDLGFNIDVVGRSNKANRRVQTSSLVKETKFYGRASAKEDLVQLLMKDESSNSRYSVIPIVGMGAIGKTTLAQLVYNDERLKFDYKAWVCVSDDFDILRLTKTILLHWERCEDTVLNILQEKLKVKLLGKKFFIVLDDVWQHNYEDWTTLCGPFAAGASGSKVIITTREKDVSLRMGSVEAYNLKELPYDECLCLFAQHALEAENFDANPDLKEVGQKIVKRCKGLPLAAKTLGGLLRHKQNLEDWEDILNSDIWELSEGENVILSALRLSYLHLPFHLKRCFAYCAIFPKEYEFDENMLVLLWMAEGFLKNTKQKKQGKDLGHQYFKDLLSRSLFQESNFKSRYVMHDLISDLAQSISGEICFHLDDQKSSDAAAHAKVRHLSFTPRQYDTLQRFKALYEMESLRTFIAVQNSSFGFWNLSTKVLEDLVPKLKCLRALSLAHYYDLKELPRSIVALKHLQYLDLRNTSVRILPESLGELLKLQTLILRYCGELIELPASIGNLFNLQHLDIRDTPLLAMPQEISKLKNLHFLPKFVVGEGNGLGIGELMRLPHLQGELRITGLQNVTNIRDAKLANLKERKGLGELALEWSYYFNDARNESHEKQVLTSLQPHQSLEKLSIICYGGIEFPMWVGSPSFSKMVNLQLSGCCKCTSLPSLGRLPALRHLSIKAMHKLRGMAVEYFPSLETLHIGNMLEWEQWQWSDIGLNEEAGGNFPKLVELTLEDCPMLIGKLPRCLPSLKKLRISSCQKLTNLPEMLPSLCELKVEDCHEAIFQMVPDFTSLLRLNISRISGLLSLHDALVQALVALEDLVIKECYELEYVWQNGDKLANLKQLNISYCRQLRLLVEGEEGLLPRNLQVLSLYSCYNLEKLPNGLRCLTSLRELTIWECKKLVSFPEEAGLPYTLKFLDIRSCDSLESVPDRVMTMVHGNYNSSQCLVEKLIIHYCPSLKSFPKGKLLKMLVIERVGRLESEYWFVEEIMQCDVHLEDLSLRSFSITSFPAAEFPTSLKTLEITGFKKIQSLPSLINLSHLTRLKIKFCDELESFTDEELPLPNLITLWISDCDKLRSLPSHMDSLQGLFIYRCSGLVSFSETGLSPKLTSLEVRSCKNLRQPITEWRLHTLTSLKRLSVGFESPYYYTTEVDCFPDEDGLLLPTSLTSLTIYDHNNLKSISRGIQRLTFLERLIINGCPKLHVLPKEGFPATLGYLYIFNCPLLNVEDHRGFIAHIPRVAIDSGMDDFDIL